MQCNAMQLSTSKEMYYTACLKNRAQLNASIWQCGKQLVLHSRYYLDGLAEPGGDEIDSSGSAVHGSAAQASAVLCH